MFQLLIVVGRALALGLRGHAGGTYEVRSTRRVVRSGGFVAVVKTADFRYYDDGSDGWSQRPAVDPGCLGAVSKSDLRMCTVLDLAALNAVSRRDSFCLVCSYVVAYAKHAVDQRVNSRAARIPIK